MRAVRRAIDVARKQGLPAAIAKTVLHLVPGVGDRPSLVPEQLAMAVDPRAPGRWRTAPRTLPDGPLEVAWIMAPPGANSGGHQNIFRFIRVLEDAGHRVRIHLTSTIDPTTPEQAAALVAGSSSYVDVAAPISGLPAHGLGDDVDVVVATGWETAYAAFADPSDARRMYFVQDFEPWFTAMGSEYVLAESTYRFGFHGITAGRWLESKLREEYGMSTAAYDFGSDPGNYSVVNRDRRDAVFFYARPETPRRGFELGVMALQLVHRERPDAPIILAGQDVRRIRIPFPYESHGTVHVGDLNGLYNRCAAGLVLSLSNMSLLPLELLGSGVVPIVNDAPNNRLVSDNPYIAYAEPTPRSLADRIIEALDRPDQAEHAVRAAASVRGVDWGVSAAQFLEAFARGLDHRARESADG